MKQNAEFPRVLVISNNCFSKTDSNGRTLGNFFVGWPKDRLAQFYIQNASPDFEVCENYFRVTDGQAVKALLGKAAGGRVTPDMVPASAATSSAAATKKRNRNALTMMVRNLESGRVEEEWFRCVGGRFCSRGGAAAGGGQLFYVRAGAQDRVPLRCAAVDLQ